MDAIITEEEGLASGLCLTAEEADTVIEGLNLLRRHAKAVADSGRPYAEEASENIFARIVPVQELLIMMFEDGIIRPRKTVTEQIQELLEPDPWGQAEQRSEYQMADEAYDTRGFADDYDYAGTE